RRKFYMEDCFSDSRAGTVEMIESEHIVSFSVENKKGQVITRFRKPFSSEDEWDKQRYRLEPTGDTWLIREVQLACFSCGGESGKNACVLCHGAGWLSGDPRLTTP